MASARRASDTTTSLKKSERHSAADGFLKPVLDRHNLTVRTGAQVMQITFDGDRATGVEYEIDGDRVRADAQREIVLSARSEERRVGKECRIGCRSRWSAYH